MSTVLTWPCWRRSGSQVGRQQTWDISWPVTLDTYFHNGLNSYLHSITRPNKLLRISENGDITYSIRSDDPSGQSTPTSFCTGPIIRTYLPFGQTFTGFSGSLKWELNKILKKFHCLKILMESLQPIPTLIFKFFTSLISCLNSSSCSNFIKSK